MTDDQGDKPVTSIPAWTVGALLSDMVARQSKALPTPTAPPHTVVAVPSLPACDVCKYDLGQPDVPATYDGKTKRGPWAYMCEECFADQGIGLGLGLGQRLEVRS
jgi:hypothetical protein